VVTGKVFLLKEPRPKSHQKDWASAPLLVATSLSLSRDSSPRRRNQYSNSFARSGAIELFASGKWD
jgi:hypothetical protein